MEKYADSNYESDEWTQYKPKHGVNYYSSDESRSKKKMEIKKNVTKKLQTQSIQKMLVIKKNQNTQRKIIRKILILIM